MKTLIIYASSHGCAEKSAQKLADLLGDDTEVSEVRNLTRIDLEDYQRVIIGGSIHAGRIQTKIKTFCQRYLNQLLEKQIGLFICHMEEDKDKAMKELTDNFPAVLVEHSTANGLFGGEFNFDKMNFLEKFIIKKVAKVTESMSTYKEAKVSEFAEKIKSA